MFSCMYIITDAIKYKINYKIPCVDYSDFKTDYQRNLQTQKMCISVFRNECLYHYSGL